jgi:outer membrane protein OmpA-like peptidoglycan-associated protein
MSETSARRKPRDGSSDSLAELRSLLLGPEQSRLGRLQQRLDDPALLAKDVSRVLPLAVGLSSSESHRLQAALLPVVQESIQISVRKDPRVLANALFPILGPAIRTAVARAFSAMVQSLHDVLEQGLSLQGLKWRVEAIRTGKPFAEIVLLHTLIYSVEQVLLIHRRTGLLLQHVLHPSATARDPNSVSGMLTAIQDFVRDSFNLQSGQTVESFEAGDLKIWVESGPDAALVAIIRGIPPPELRRKLQECIEGIHRELAKDLEEFAGDASVFELASPHLEACLETATRTKRRTRPYGFWLLLGVGLLLLFLWGFSSIRESRRWTDYIGRLKQEPGIVLVAAERQHGRYVVSGLRDPLARDPSELLKESGVTPDRVVSRWEPYSSGVPAFVLERAKAVLAPPETVNLSFANGTLHLSGVAPHRWITEARRFARWVPGVVRADLETLDDLERRELDALKQRLEGETVRFQPGSSQLLPGQAQLIENLGHDLARLARLASESGLNARVDIFGHTDDSGSEQLNAQLSYQRAAALRRLLESSAGAPLPMTTQGLGSSQPVRVGTSPQDRAWNRSASLRISLSPGAGQETRLP